MKYLMDKAYCINNWTSSITKSQVITFLGNFQKMEIKQFRSIIKEFPYLRDLTKKLGNKMMNHCSGLLAVELQLVQILKVLS